MLFNKISLAKAMDCRGGSRTAATSKMELFVIIVNGFQPLTIIAKQSILDVAAALDPPLDWVRRHDKQLTFTGHIEAILNNPFLHVSLTRKL